MSMPAEAMQKILLEIEQKAAISRQQLQSVEAQIAAKNRDTRILDLATKEIESLKPGTNVYEGMGKMFVATEKNEVIDRLKKEQDAIKSDLEGLGKRQHYLETILTNTSNSLKQFLGR